MQFFYLYIDAVDSQNARNQAYIALEETRSTRRRGNRLFAFLLALFKVNPNLGENQICGVEAVR